MPWLGMGRMRQLRDKMWGIKATPKPLGVNHSLSAEKEWEERLFESALEFAQALDLTLAQCVPSFTQISTMSPPKLTL